LFNSCTPLTEDTSMIQARRISLTRATLEERWDCPQTQHHPWIDGKPSPHLLRRYLLKISPNILSEYLRSTKTIRLQTLCCSFQVLKASHKPLLVSHPSFPTTIRQTADTVVVGITYSSTGTGNSRCTIESGERSRVPGTAWFVRCSTPWR
jgi:hypothetical protein